ncbi:hypothetical protein ABPG75_013791 [Micractinium tetrahymenae]
MDPRRQAGRSASSEHGKRRVAALQPLELSNLSIRTDGNRRKLHKLAPSAMRVLPLLCLGLLVLCAPAAQARRRRHGPRYNNPTVRYEGNQVPLDFCKEYGKDCGQPAADYFCRRLGWAKAADFGGPVGVQCPADQPDCVATVVLKSHEPCTPGQWPCSTFAHITCTGRRPPPEQTGPYYSHPAVRVNHRNVKLDWCLNFGQDCGRPAADNFCKHEGWDEAVSFGGPEEVKCPASRPDCVATWVLGSQKPCTPSGYPCNTFKYIKCGKKPHGPRYDHPTVLYKGRRVPLDNYLTFGKDCGQPAADYFCQRRGWARAAGFGGPVEVKCPADQPDCVATVVLKSREPCTPGQWPCSAFEYIECADRVYT